MAKLPKLPEYPLGEIILPNDWLADIVAPNCDEFFREQSFRRGFNACVSCYHFIEVLYHYDAWKKMKEMGLKSTSELSGVDSPNEDNFKNIYEPYFLSDQTEFGKSFRFLKNVTNNMKRRFLYMRPGQVHSLTTATGIISVSENPWCISLPESYKLIDPESNFGLGDDLEIVLLRWKQECQKRGLNIISVDVNCNSRTRHKNLSESDAGILTIRFPNKPPNP